MKRIGILTLPFNNNYGGYLQAYALMLILKQMGHDVELINRRHNRRPAKWRFVQTIKNIIKLLIGKKVHSLIPNQTKELWIEGEKMMPFVIRNIQPQTEPIYSSKELYNLLEKKKYDYIVVGSDQVWRPDYVPNADDYFLPFLSKNTKRISYAASFGTDSPFFSDDLIKLCGIGYSYFESVSLREEQGLRIIKEQGWIGQKDPVLVLDPTMLLHSCHYSNILCNDKIVTQDKVFCYFLDESLLIQEVVNLMNSHYGYSHVNLLDLQYGVAKPSIEEWISCIKNAAFVVTDSFHGAVFCILFNKPFVVCVNKDRGKSRLDSLLKPLGLESRLVTDISELDIDSVFNVNWSIINKIVEKERKKSINYLRMAIY